MEQRFETFTVLINKIRRSIRKIEHLEMAEYGLRSTHVSCLYSLYSRGALTAAELCDQCDEDKATISRSLEFLEKEGYLTCSAQKNKRYKTPLVLTPKGEKTGAEIAKKIHRILGQIGAGISEEERCTFYQHLTTISNQLEELTQSIQ